MSYLNIKYDKNNIEFSKKEIFDLAVELNYECGFKEKFNSIIYSKFPKGTKIPDEEIDEICNKVKNEANKMIDETNADSFIKINNFINSINDNEYLTSDIATDITIHKIHRHQCMISITDQNRIRHNFIIMEHVGLQDLRDENDVTILDGSEFKNKYILKAGQDIGSIEIPMISSKLFKFELLILLEDNCIKIEDDMGYNLKNAYMVNKFTSSGKEFDITPYYDKEEKVLYAPITAGSHILKYKIPIKELYKIITDIKNDLYKDEKMLK